MTNDDVRTLLVEQGALMLLARIKATSAKDKYTEALEEWSAACEPLLADDVVEAAAALSITEQEQCFRDSAVLAGYSPDDAHFEMERRAFAEMRLIDQSYNAEMN